MSKKNIQVRPDDLTKEGDPHNKAHKWIIPYIDQPICFWQDIADKYSNQISEVYFPLPADIMGSGEPTQPSEHLKDFLRSGVAPCSVLLNSITLKMSVEALAPKVIETLKKLIGEYGLAGATVTNLNLATLIREALPDLHLTASCLMEISKPNQALMINGICNTLVPSNRTVRDLPALRKLKEAFSGNLRLLVNEACLPGCPFRIQHFHEMGNDFPHPLSLCTELLNQQPWLRITGGWILPQHLHLYEGIYDDLKLGGRVTLRHPDHFLKVVEAYIHRKPLSPNVIGGGPASVLYPIEVTEEYFSHTLDCRHDCHECRFCSDYYNFSIQKLRDKETALNT